MANSTKTRGISFPFRRGSFSLPARNAGAETIVDAVRALLLTGQNEIPFAPNLGTNIHSFVFENMSEIQKVRIAQAIRTIISNQEPRMRVVSVSVQEAGNANGGYRFVVNVVYQIADQRGDFDLPLG
jgi:phage baseplate assembly protein W